MKKNKYKNIRSNSNKIFSKAKEIFSTMTDIPNYVLANISKITMISNEQILIEGYKAVDEYYTHYIKILGINIEIIIDGKELDIKEINEEDIMVEGKIYSINFKKNN